MELQEQILHDCHDHPMAGHKGINKTKELIKRQFWWPNMTKDIKQYVLGCGICAQGKPTRQSPQGLLQPMPIPPHPWHTVTMDLFVDLPSSRGLLDLAPLP